MLVALLTVGPVAAQAPVGVGWSGTADGVAVRWTATNIVASATDADRTLYDVRQSISAGVLARYPKQWPFRSYEVGLSVTSFVGSLVTLRERTTYENPGTFTQEENRAVDPRDPHRRILLSDIFPESDILQALLADKIIRAALAEIGRAETPTRIADLAGLLTDQLPEPNPTGPFFPPGWLGGFAFHHLQGDKVAVRIAIPYVGGMRAQTVEQIGILLPIPKALLGPLADAARRSAGFLMNDVRPDSEARFTIGPRR